MSKKVWVYDLETLDIFTATFLHRDSDEKRVFVLTNIEEDEFHRYEFFQFLDTEVLGLIGYNCLFFDAQVLEYIFRNPDCSALEIRNYAQIITSDSDRRMDVPEWKLRIPQLDLFKALSLSVKAKRTGLKWCEYMLDMDNIEDMPSQGDGNNWKEMVLSYNLNDVIATKNLYQKYIHEIELRKSLSNREGINLLNCTEPDMAKKLFLKYLSKAMNIPANDLKAMQTNRKFVHIKDIIFPYIEFKTPILQNVKREFEKLTLTQKDKFEFNVIYKDVEINYALGGIHASISNRVVQSDDVFIIKSLDVVSFYPNLAIRNKLHPAHLPQNIFCNLYESLYNERRSIPKKDPRNYILKILLNATYGLSNDEYSFLKDRQFTLSICINGQLTLSMLFEELLESIPTAKLLMLNTDGGEIMIPRAFEDMYYNICNKWMQLTNLELEFVDYSKLIIKDVNNYIAQKTSGETKCKGIFEFENIPLHKNKSHAIIPRAFYEYFINGKRIEETILDHKNIFDFCAGVRAKKSDKKGYSHFELHSIEGSDIKKVKLSKTVRYFISRNNQYLFKVYEDGSLEHVEAPTKINKSRTKDWKVTYFNKAYYPERFSDYNIDFTYYISKTRDLINLVEDSLQKEITFQQTLL